MPATMTTVSAGLKEIYEGRIRDQLNEEAVAIKRIERSSEGVTSTVGGKYVTFPIRVTRNSGISYRAESGQMAPAGQQGYAAVTIPLKYGYGRFQFTGQVMRLADENFRAFTNMADQEMDGLKTDLVKDTNRISYGSGVGNGVLAMVMDTATSATHAVNNIQYLEVGMVVDVLVVSSGSATGGAASTQATPVTINSITPTTAPGGNVTFSTSMGPTVSGPTSAGHGIYRFGNRGVEPNGLSTIIASSGQLQGVDPATQPQWAASVINNSGTAIALSETTMIRACDTARRRGGKTSAIFTSLGVRRAYFNLLTQQRRYTDTKSFPGGFQGLPFNYGSEIPLVEDPDAPPSKMWFVDESHLKIYRRQDWAFDDLTGAVLKWVRDYDIYEGFAVSYWELATDQRNAHCLYDDITEA